MALFSKFVQKLHYPHYSWSIMHCPWSVMDSAICLIKFLIINSYPIKAFTCLIKPFYIQGITCFYRVNPSFGTDVYVSICRILGKFYRLCEILAIMFLGEALAVILLLRLDYLAISLCGIIRLDYLTIALSMALLDRLSLCACRC